MKKAKQIIIVLIFVLIIGGFSALHLLTPDKDVSTWERRKLQPMPKVSVSSLSNGSFMRNFETYLTDHFPFRDSFRTLKAKFHFNVLGQKDNNGIYIVDGSASKLDRSIDTASVENFTKKVTALYNTYVKPTDCKAFFTLIPDKNFYLAEGTLYPHYSFSEIYELTVKGLPAELEKIDIYPLLSQEAYYSTDSHWRQEKIIPVADYIRKSLGMEALGEFEKKDAGDFHGVYYGQSALPLEADRLFYLTNEETESSVVTSIEKRGETKVYDLSKLEAFDKYDIFLSGAVSVMEISNTLGEKGKELILFRDSFTSSLAPLLLSGYSKVTLVDTRYILPEMVGDYVSFTNQDVMFIYGTGIVNSSAGLK